VYGTGAFLGVINLITRPKGEKTHGEVALGTAENAVFRSRGTAVVKLGEDAGMWVSVAGATSSGRDHYFPEYHADPTSPDVERDAYGRPVDGIARNVDGFGAGTFGARAWYKAFSLQAFLSGRRKTLPTGEYETIFNDQRTRFNDLRGFVEARFDPRLSETVQLQSRVSLDLYDFSATLAYPPPGGVGRDRYRGRWAGTEVRCILTPSERLRFTAGGEFISHFLTRQTGSDDQGPIVFDAAGNPGRNDPFAVAAGYALADWGVSPRVKVSAGARLDYYSNLPRFDLAAQTNPRLAVIWKPYDRGNVKVLAGKAFRAPSVYELFYTSTTQVPAENLGPEQIYSGEVEYSHRFSTTVVGSITGFTNYVTDLIELRDVQPGINQYTNSSANVIVPGGEAELRREWREGFMAAAQYTIQAPQYVGDGALRDVPNAPNHLASVRAAAPIVGRSLMIMSRLTLEGARRDRFDRDTDPPQGRTHAGVVWDIVFSGEIERIAARYNIGLYNAADQRYDTVPSSEFRQRTIVQNGRTVLASVMVAF
jgi:outer membrane receptor protein involved in Fe transport